LNVPKAFFTRRVSEALDSLALHVTSEARRLRRLELAVTLLIAAIGMGLIVISRGKCSHDNRLPR
jgi:hypothetical protein